MIIKAIRKCLFISSQLHFSPIHIARALLATPGFISDYIGFRLISKDWKLRIYPVLLDKEQGSAHLGEYFWQDLFVAKKIISQNPTKHVDVGSRVDGFIAHLACVRKVEVFDIRPLTSEIENVEFTQWDITNPNPALNGIADCVSCLHTLEHIGLGRYGDQLDPDGWRKGLKSLVDLVAPGGGLWLSVPIGRQRVEFNAHRVFDPKTIADCLASMNILLDEFYYLDNNQIVKTEDFSLDSIRLSEKSYSLGIFYLTRK